MLDVEIPERRLARLLVRLLLRLTRLLRQLLVVELDQLLNVAQFDRFLERIIVGFRFGSVRLDQASVLGLKRFPVLLERR